MKRFRPNSATLLASTTLLAALAAGAVQANAAPPVTCTATFSLLNTPADTGAIQFTANYSGALIAPDGAGASVSCTSLLVGSLVAINDDEAAQTLRWGDIALTGITATPVQLGQCSFSGTDAAKASDIVVTVLDAATEAVDGIDSNVCGAPVTGSTPPYSRDALVILKKAVSQPVTCQLCECDLNNNGAITASDSLLALKAAVQQPIVLDCPACVDPVDTSAVTASATVGVALSCTFSCPPTPDATCLAGAKSSLQISDNASDDKDSLKWKVSGGPLTEQGDLGDPTGSTNYTLCVYDSTASSDTLATSLTIPAGSLWTVKDPKGVAYKDTAGANSGVTKASVKTGAAGKSKISVAAKGVALPLPTPISGTEFFDQDPRVVVQLHSDAAPKCWSSEFTTATKNTAAKFIAKNP